MKKRGIGLASMIYGMGFGFGRPDYAAATLEMAEDGSVTLRTGCADMGQGSSTVLAQMVAEELGVPYEAVRVVSADTATTPDAGPSTASRQTFTSGRAVLSAAREVKESLLGVASEALEAAPEDLWLSGGRISVRGSPERFIPIKEAASRLHREGRLPFGKGFHRVVTKDLDPESPQGDSYVSYLFASQMAEVEVDTGTGEVKVLRFWAAHDVGRAINPMNVEGQVDGAVALGTGYALIEEFLAADGTPLTPSLESYLLPTSLDTPEVETIIVEEQEPQGPYGAKGVGEAAAIPSAPAIINAIEDAVGIRIYDLPATAEKILRALKEQKPEGS